MSRLIEFSSVGRDMLYLGAGINCSVFYNQDAGSADKLDVKNTFGAALRVGFDDQLTDRWEFNVDVKKIFLQPKFDVTVGGAELSGRAKITAPAWAYRF